MNEMEDLVRRRELPVIEKTGFFLKGSSNQVLPIGKNHDEQVSLLRWDSLLDSAVSKFKAEVYKRLKRYTQTEDGYIVVKVVPNGFNRLDEFPPILANR